MILREAFDYEFSRLDPRGGAHIDPPSVAVYETLMVKSPDGQPRPGLAHSWGTSDDGLEWRVRLRRGARFHSGAPCDAEAVRAALHTLRFGEEEADQLWYWDPVDEVRADGDDTLVFTLNHPYARLPSLLWGTHTAIHNDALRRETGDRYGCDVADGTGPFRLVSWSPQRVVAERHDGRARVARIEWVSILDEQGRLAALERGEVHCLHGPPLDEVDRLAADERFVVTEFPQASNVYLALDWRRGDLGFDRLDVRRAVSLALDRPAIVREALAGRGFPTLGALPPGDEFYDPEIDRDAGRCDPETARLLLDGLTFECVCQDDAVHRRVAACVSDQLARSGVRLELRFAKPFARFYEACAVGPASFINKWLWQDPLDAVIGFSSTRCRGFPNWQHASIPELDAAFRDWLRAGTQEDLRAVASRAQRIAAEQLPYVPLVTPSDAWVRSAALHGWEPYPANLYPYYQEARLDATR